MNPRMFYDTQRLPTPITMDNEFMAQIRNEQSAQITRRARDILQMLTDNPRHIYLITFKSDVPNDNLTHESIDVSVKAVNSIAPSVTYKHGECWVNTLVANIEKIEPICPLDMGVV